MANARKPPGSPAYSASTPKGDVYRVSFFDEDDEPTRRAPRPRRTAPAGGARVDPQTLWTRRAVAIGVGLLVVCSCSSSSTRARTRARKNALRDYNREVADDRHVRRTPRSARRSSRRCAQGASQSPEDLQTQVSTPAVGGGHEPRPGPGPRHAGRPQGRAGVAADRARAAPRRAAAHLRADRRRALGTEGDVADEAIEAHRPARCRRSSPPTCSSALAVTPLRPRRAQGQRRRGRPRRDRRASCRRLDWLQPDFVAEPARHAHRRRRRRRRQRQRRQGHARPARQRPGRPPTVDGVDLTPGADGNERVAARRGHAFTVTFANQGENTSSTSRSTSRCRAAPGKDITGSETVDTIAQGEHRRGRDPAARASPTADRLHGQRRGPGGAGREEDRQQQSDLQRAVRVGRRLASLARSHERVLRRARDRRPGRGRGRRRRPDRRRSCLSLRLRRAARRPARRARARPHGRPRRPRRRRCSTPSRRCAARSRRPPRDSTSAWATPSTGSTARSPTARWCATTPTASCRATSPRRSRCSTPSTTASCCPRSPTASPRACTASRSIDGEGELELSPEEAEAVRLALAGELGTRVLETE